MLAAGLGQVGGLGARAIYGDRTLTLREFREAWMCQQALLTMSSEEGRGDTATRVSVRRTLAAEKAGIFDQVSAPRPDWLPLDPLDPGFDPATLPPHMGIT